MTRIHLTRLLALGLSIGSLVACATAAKPPAASAQPGREALQSQRSLNSDLIQAAERTDLLAIRSLLAAGASPHARDTDRRTALMKAVSAGHLVTERVIQEGLGARVEIIGLPAPTPTDEQRAVVALLLEQGVDVEAADNNGKTALVYAVERDYAGIGAMLLAAGANPDLRVGNGLPLVCLAASRGFDATLRVLIEGGADLDARGMHGKQALHYAAEENRIAAARVLLDQAVPVDLTSAADWTPLHTAVSRGHREMVALLLDRGAAPHAVTARGLTPARIATARGYNDITRLLDSAAGR